jgi:hypothetical protein
VSFADLLIKVPHRKVRIELALEPTQPRDGGRLDPLAPRASAALLHYRLHPVLLDCLPDAPQMACVIVKNSVAWTQLNCPKIALTITSRSVIAPRLPSYYRSIARLYPIGRRTSLNVYAPDTPNVCDTSRVQ